MTITPTSNRLFVRRDEGEQQASSGLWLAPKAVDMPLLGEVISVGPDVSEVAAGDRILFAKYTGETFELRGETVMVFEESDVMAVVE